MAKHRSFTRPIFEAQRAEGNRVGLPGGPGAVLAGMMLEAFAARLARDIVRAKRVLRTMRAVRNGGYHLVLP